MSNSSMEPTPVQAPLLEVEQPRVERKSPTWPTGSEWRKWDLHVHTPASHGFSGDYAHLVIQLGNADCAVIGLNDYFTVAGYAEVVRRLTDPAEASNGNQAYRDALEKLRVKSLLPVVECRMNNLLFDRTKGSGPEVNFHIIFNPAIPIDDIETFIKGMSVKGSSIGSRYADKTFLSQASVNFTETLNRLAGDRALKGNYLIWIPYDEYGGIDKISPTSHPLFKEGLVTEADMLGSSNKRTIDFFLWKDPKYTNEQYAQWFGRRKPCIKGSDSHNVHDEVGKLKDRDSKPTDRYCWIKADPTFNGLRQIVNEPEDRVFIGRLPAKLSEVSQRPTQFLKSVKIKPVQAVDEGDVWFNCDVPINPDMVAIIGNKGSGKSALADAIALAGNSHCDPKYFSFLSNQRFCKNNGQLAKRFEVVAEWRDGTSATKPLNGKADLNSVELVKYIPQSYLETVCTETESGERSEFQQELRKVIYSHIPDADRLGKGSLDELIDYETEELKRQLEGRRADLGRINAELAKLQAKGKRAHIKQIESELKQKQKELQAHDAAKPAEVAAPDKPDAQREQAINAINKKLVDTRKSFDDLTKLIDEKRAKLKATTELLAISKRLIQKLESFESEFKRLKQDCSADAARLGLSIDELLEVTVKPKSLADKSTGLTKEKEGLEHDLAPDLAGSLVSKKVELESAIEALQEQLDEPNRRFQAYQDDLRKWHERRSQIVGTSEDQSTLAYCEAQVKHLTGDLPTEIQAKLKERTEQARLVYQSINDIRSVYRDLFGPIQGLIQETISLKEGFKLTFDGRIIERHFDRGFFELVNQGVVGSFCGKDKGAATLAEILAEYDFNTVEGAVAFAEAVQRHLEQDVRYNPPQPMEVETELRKHVALNEVYDYIWSFGYLQPEYSLKLDGKDLSLLSPGERGTLLLIFYLVVDKTNVPIIVDQPEENLDNQTVYKLLIPIIKAVKQRRQILMVTHNPNIAVVCDAEEIIHANIDRAHGNRVTYSTGSIESFEMNDRVVDVLEGTRPAFDNRDAKYFQPTGLTSG